MTTPHDLAPGRNIINWNARTGMGKLRLVILAATLAILFVVLVSFDSAAAPMLDIPRAYDQWLEYAFFAGAGMWVLGMILSRTQWGSLIAETGIFVAVAVKIVVGLGTGGW